MKAFIVKHPILSLAIAGAVVWFIIKGFHTVQKVTVMNPDFGVDPNFAVPPILN